ncbi:MAG TPA: ABC transporter permease [Mycobacteriales bacterium]
MTTAVLAASDLTLPPAPSGALSRLRWATRDSLVIAGRSIRQIRNVPERLSDVTIQPIMFVLLFAEVFGTAIVVPGGGSYHEYLLPGIIAQSTVFGTFGAAIGMATDRHEGFVDRLRSLPIARGSVLTGRMTAEVALASFGLLVNIVVGLLVGWRVHRGLWHTLLAVAILLSFVIAMTWLGTLIGLLVRSQEAVPGILFPILFPITFLANTFVPITGLPGWLKVIAEWNPVSAVVAACRGQFGNPNPGLDAWPLQHAIAVSFGWAVIISVVCASLALLRWRNISIG